MGKGLHFSRAQRPPRGYSSDVRDLEAIKRKDFIGMSDFSTERAASPDLPEEVVEWFARATPLMEFLCTAVGVEF